MSSSDVKTYVVMYFLITPRITIHKYSYMNFELQAQAWTVHSQITVRLMNTAHKNRKSWLKISCNLIDLLYLRISTPGNKLVLTSYNKCS